MEHATPRSARYAWNALWMLDHLLGAQAVDRAAPRVRERVERGMGEALARTGEGGFRPVDRRADLDPAAFVREYVAQDRPVILAGAAKDWPATRTWDLDFFIANYGDEPIQLMNASAEDDPADRAGPERPLGEILREAKAGSRVYPRFVPLLNHKPRLLEDLDRRWLKRVRGPTGKGLNLQLFIGGPGSSTALHCAIGSNLFVQVHGRKRWTIASPAWSPALAVELTRSPYFFSLVDLEKPDLARFPWLRHVDGWTADLEAGDVLYNPPFFWHQVRNPTPSIGVGVRFMDPPAMLRASRTLTALTLLASNPPLWRAAQLRGDFSKIFTGRW